MRLAPFTVYVSFYILPKNWIMIYLVKIKNTNWVKVGYASNIESRIASYKTSMPKDIIEYIRYMDGTRKDEKDYHYRFQEYREHPGSEWMCLPEEHLKEIESEFEVGLSANLLKVYKPSKKLFAGERKVKWYDEHIDELIGLCKSGMSLNKAAKQLGIKNDEWITYTNRRCEKEKGIKLSHIWRK